MTSYFLANVSDLAITAIGLKFSRVTELNPLGNDFSLMREILQVDNGQAILITKLAVTTALISLYALSQENKNRLTWPVEKALIFGNVLYWSIVCWNVFNVGFELTAVR